MSKPRKIRAEFRKNRLQSARRTDWTQHVDTQEQGDDVVQGERIGKGEHTRKRTIFVSGEDNGDDTSLLLDAAKESLPGRVLCMHGLTSEVVADDGQVYDCAVRRLLKTLSTDQRHVIAAGDRVLFRPVPSGDEVREGMIERVEPRHGIICREVRGRQQILVANVDQLLIISSAAEPRLKPNLIDRMLVTAEKGGIEPLICINKIDLIEPDSIQSLVGVYSRMGYQVLLLSATTGQGIDRLRRRMQGRESVVAGQSGVGKSSLLNAMEPDFHLKVRTVSAENEKGRHTTTTARLMPLSFGGFVVDTPGVRQFQLWDVVPAEVANFYRDLRPYVSLCRFPDCTHTHETDCAVKNAVSDGRLDERRYDSYCHLFAGEMESE
jgi:ribosome biogenesis GTPase